MRNIEFKEDEGPGFWRRLLAFLVILLCLTAAAGYRYFFVTADYQTSLTLLVKEPGACDRLLADTLRDREHLLKSMNTRLAPLSLAPALRPGFDVKTISPDDLPQAEETHGSAAKAASSAHPAAVPAAPVEVMSAAADPEGEPASAGMTQRLSQFVTGLVPERVWSKAALEGIQIARKPDGLLEITCLESAVPFHEEELAGNQALMALLKDMEQSALQGDKLRVQEGKNRINRQRQKLAAEAGELPKKFAVKAEVVAAVRSLNEAAAGKDGLNGGWMEAFPKNGEAGRIAAGLEKQLEHAKELSRQIVRDRELCGSIEKWIRAPENQSVTRKTKRVVYHEDTPELIRIRDKKAELEASRMRLLQRATSQHPTVRKLSLEIEELQSQIEALTRLPEVVEDVVEETNPEMNSWQKQLADTVAAIKGTEARLTVVRQNILMLAEQLRQAEERQRMLDLTNEKQRIQTQLATLTENAPEAAGLPFSVYLPAGRPQMVRQPAAWPIYAGALGFGLVCAVLLLLTRRRTRFGVFEKPEEVLPEYPVLGSIPRFGADGHQGGHDTHAAQPERLAEARRKSA